MNISRKNKLNKKIIIIISCAVLIIVAVIIGYLSLHTPDQTSNNVSEDNTEINISPDKEDAMEGSISQNRESEKNPIQNDATDVDQTTLNGYITAKNVANGTLQVRVQIEQYLTSGTCKITVGSYSEQTDVIPNPSSSTCKGWDIPISKLQKGKQTITIHVNSASNNLTITDEVVI